MATLLRLKLLPGGGIDNMGESMSLRPFTHRYVTGRAARGEIVRHTIASHRSTLATLARVHGKRDPGKLGRRTIERWLEDRRHLKPSSLRTAWSCVNGFCDWLVAENIIGENPCRAMRSPKVPRSVPRALDADAMVALLRVLPDARARAIVWLMFGSGLRRVEVSRLNVEDWSRRDGILLLRGKGGHERTVPIVTLTARALGSYLTEHPATSGPLIRSYTSPWRPLGADRIGQLLSGWFYEAGVKHAAGDGVSGHALRHTCASDTLDACHDLRVVQELLGHQHLATTSVYLRRARVTEMRAAMEGRTFIDDAA